MAFKLENFGAEVANAKSTLGGICYYRYFNEENNTLTTAGYFPATLGLEVGDRIRVIPSVKTNADEMYVVTSTANRTVTVTQIDTDGAVDSVNGKTGTVVLTAEDINAIPQLTTMPTASADLNGKIVQYTGATDATYTNGYFYKCAGAGEPVVYSWTQTNVQPAPSGLPDQTGQSGKFLTTDGTDASWSDKPLVNYATATGSLTILGTAATNGSWGINIGQTSSLGSNKTAPIAIGYGAASSGERSIAIGNNATSAGNGSICIGRATVNSANTILLNATEGVGLSPVNDPNTMYVAIKNGVLTKLLSSDETIPAARHASLPATDGTYVLKLIIASGVPTLSWVAE